MYVCILSKTQLTRLQKLQNQAVSLVNPLLDVSKMAKQHKILHVNELIQLENYKIWFKHHSKCLPKNLQELMRTDHKSSKLLKTHRYSTCNKKEINLPVADTKTYRSSFLFKGLRDYQLLPMEMKSEKNGKKFVTSYKEHLLSIRKF